MFELLSRGLHPWLPLRYPSGILRDSGQGEGYGERGGSREQHERAGRRGAESRWGSYESDEDY